MLKEDLQEVKKQKDSLKQGNYELMAQIKDVTNRLNHVESKLIRMNTDKAKLDEMLQIGAY